MGKVPVDEGWAWAVCGGASVIMMFSMGSARSFGILLLEISSRFQAKQGLSALTLGLIVAGIALFAPVGNFLGMRFTYRVTVMMGAAIACVSAFLASFATNIYYVIIVFGLLTGIGYGLMFAPTMVVIVQYFDKRRAIANSLGVAGASVGQLVFPPLLAYLLSEYNFSGTMLIFSAIALHAFAAAALFRPPAFFTASRLRTPQTAVAQQAPQRPAFDKGLFKDVFYICFVLALCFGHCGYISMCLFIAPFASEDLEVPREQAALLLSILGVADLVGRIFTGWFADFHLIATNRLIALGLLITGATGVFVTFGTTYWTLVILTIVLGLLGALYISLGSVLLVEKLGLARMQAAFGVATLCMGVCIVPVPTILGIIKDATGSFKPGYRLCGVLMIIGGIFMFIGPILAGNKSPPQQQQQPGREMTAKNGDKELVESA